MLYIVVPTFSRISVFQKFIEQIRMQSFTEYKLLVIDHGEKKTGFHEPNVTVIESDVNGWAHAINIGLRHILKQNDVVESDSILVINDDVCIDKDYLRNVNHAIKRRKGALIGSVCYDWNSKKLLHINMKLKALKAAYDYKNLDSEIHMVKGRFYDSDVLKGRGTVLPVKVLREIGIYEENRLPHYRADHELAWRAKQKGYEVCVCGNMQVGAVLDSPHTVEQDLNFWQNYRNIFLSMLSTCNTKDLWNYARCCFKPLYGFYFFVVNCLRNHLWFMVKFLRTRKTSRCLSQKNRG